MLLGEGSRRAAGSADMQSERCTSAYISRAALSQLCTG